MLVQTSHCIKQRAVVIIGEQIHLIDNQQSRDIVCHCRGEETVDKRGVGHGMGQCNDKHSLV